MWSKLSEALGLIALDYPVPTHANTLWYSLGGITAVCFSATILTGIILSQFYDPAPAAAHASVRYIMDTPGLGFIRALHHWSGNLGFLLLLIHMIRVMFTHAYRTPRAITYLVGLALLFVTFQLYFTGTVIKWDQEGYEALAHFLATNKLLGPLGAVFQEDFTLSTSMLARFYALHVSIFPILLLLLIVLHGLYVKHFGISPKPYQSEEAYQASLQSGSTFSKHLRRTSVYCLILLVILVGLALMFPPGLLKAPVPGVEETKPPWVFWYFYPIESLMGMGGILLGSAVLMIGLVMIPILGFLLKEEKRLVRAVNTIVIAGLIVWLALLVITYFSPTMKHL